MNVFISWNSRASVISFSQPSFTTTTTSHFQRPSLSSPRKFILPFWAYPFPYFPNKSHHILHARKNRRSEPDHHQPLLKPTIIQEVSEDDEEDDVFLDEYEDGKKKTYPIPLALFSFLVLYFSFKVYVLEILLSHLT